MIVLFPSI